MARHARKPVSAFARTVDEMIANRGMEVIGGLLERGLSGQRLRKTLAIYYPSALKQSLEALIRRGREQRDLLRQVSRQDENTVIRPPRSLTVPDLAPGFHYTVAVETRDAQGNKRRYFTTILSESALTRAQIELQARAQMLLGTLTESQARERRNTASETIEKIVIYKTQRGGRGQQ